MQVRLSKLLVCEIEGRMGFEDILFCSAELHSFSRQQDSAFIYGILLQIHLISVIEQP